MSSRRLLTLLALLAPLACSDDGGSADTTGFTTGGTGDEATDSQTSAETGTSTSMGDGDGDPTATTTTTGDGDGDGDPTTTGDGDGDGDPTTTGDGDGDGDGTTTGGDACPLALDQVPCDANSDDPFHAMGLNCEGAPPEALPLSAVTFDADDPDSYRVANQFGSSGDWAAREGDKVLIISTGVLTDPDNDGAVILEPKSGEIGTDNANNDNVNNLPNPIEPVDGSNGVPFMGCDGQNDCSDTLEAQWDLGGGTANDLLWFKFDIDVPIEAEGYKFDFAFFTTEFPEWVDTEFNDIFLVWSTSETYTGNITFINGQPLTVTALENEIVFTGNDPELLGTGVDGVGGGPMGQGMMEPTGGGTGWFTATASALPGESFTLAWALFDMGDSYYDTTVVLDAFRWDCEGCVPSEIDSCGIEPQ